jgi:two-component system CheB/CheR fusion protein
MRSNNETLEPCNDGPQAVTASKAGVRMSTRVVGIGTLTSDRGALETLLSHLQADTGLAFIIVQHHDPAYDVIVAERLALHTSMVVTNVTDEMLVMPNHVYVIAPNRDVIIQNGVIRSTKHSTSYGMRLPIDHFFCSLAERFGDRTIGIVLSRTGADGTLGLEAIKDQGGLTIAQASNVTQNDTTKDNAIRDSRVDLVAEPDKIAAYLINYIKLPPIAENSMEIGEELPSINGENGDVLSRILAYLQGEMGHDFSGYKKNTIVRRIERRMRLNRIEKVDDYVRMLEDVPAEIDSLFRELLIGVTSFFRDPESFDSLDNNVIGPLFRTHREPWRPLRVWIPACSTGEEAYSVAILMHERAMRARTPIEFQIFATDIDHVALDKGRSGRYPASFAANIDSELLQKYFIEKMDGHTLLVGPQLRDSVVFAAQSVIKDPPFSKMDLICCRNLMIYLESPLQQRLLSIFHYALNPDGYLFLGNSETIGHSQRLFRTVDQRSKVFQRLEIGSDLKQIMQSGRASVNKLRLPATKSPDRTPNLRELTEQMLLAEHTPTAIVVNGNGDMLYVHGRTGKFLEQTTGEISTNIFKIARDGLRIPLTTALHHVGAHQTPYQIDGVSIRNETHFIHVRLSITPIEKPPEMQGMMLVTLTEMPTATSPLHDLAGTTQPTDEPWPQIDALERELSATRRYLQEALEEVETTNEQLRSTNEDLQSSNEELQGTNEELQTSKEETQSVNEELNTVNSDLHNKINDLINANTDIKNLMENALIGIILLDSNLHIRRFTHAATNIVPLIANDIGRPLAQFVHRLRHDRLLQDAQDVLDTQQTKEMELRAIDDHWYLARILPYRTLDNKVDGVVLTFSDVTQLKESKEKLEFLFDVLPVGISVLNRDRKSTKHNDAFLRMTDLSRAEYDQSVHLGRAGIRPDGTLREPNEFAISRVLAGEPSALNVESGFVRRNGRITWLDVSAVACPFPDWSVIAVTTDITVRKEAEIALQASEEKFSKAFHLAPLMIGIIDLATNTLVECNQRFLDSSGYTREEAIGITMAKLAWMPLDTGTRLREIMAKQGYVRDEEIVCWSKNGKEIDCLYNGFPIELGGRKKVVSMIYDISDRKRREEAIKTTLRSEKETVLRELAHRTKNNMFVIRSILNLHAMHTDSDEVRRLFTDVENKIVAMALVHQKLYQAKNLSRLDLGEYLRELTPVLMESYSTITGRISANIETESISALIDTAIPCGLVVTELFSNAFKHAFPDSRKGTISIRLFRRSPDTIHIEFSDNGVGVPEGFDFRNRSTLGLETIFMIVEHQLKGTVQFHATPQGLTCHIDFADNLYSERV